MDVNQLKAENEFLKAEKKLSLQQLDKLNTKLTESEAFKSHFLSNISNEIINPFTSILGLSQNIIDLKSSDIKEIHEMSKLIQNEAFDLDFQLRNIFAAAKIESGEHSLEMNLIPTLPFISKIIESLSLKANKKGLTIDFNHSFAIEHLPSDEEKLRLILSNLIMNAINFSPEGETIFIDCENTIHGFIFKINNQGSTISAKDSSIIFDRFIKLNNSINTLNLGHGLGLSIIRDFIELLNGTIELESNDENGTTFTIHLPPMKATDNNLFLDEEDLFMNGDTTIF